MCHNAVARRGSALFAGTGECVWGTAWGKGVYDSATGILPPLNCGRVYAAVGTAWRRRGRRWCLFVLHMGFSSENVDEVKRRRGAGMSRAGRVKIIGEVGASEVGALGA